MNTYEHSHTGHSLHGLRPPQALLLSIVAQIPMILFSWPPALSLASLVTGIVMLTVGLVLNLWSVRLFQKSQVGVCPFSPVGDLVSGGAYRLSRNPMYLGLVLINAGVAFVTSLPWNLWTSLALSLYLHFRFVLPEENFLEEQLGTRYLRYASNTPRWLGLPGPRITGMRAGPRVSSS